MRYVLLAMLAMSSIVSVSAQAQFTEGFRQYGRPGYKWSLPPNNLHLYDRVNRNANITEARFGQIIDEVMALWTPIATAKGVKLTVEKNWSDSTVNAYATQNGNNWSVAMFGGLARRPEVTEDGFALVVCHELGHHFAGYSFYGNKDWASAEGESDYFATNVCAKYLWGPKANENRRFYRMRGTPQTVSTACNSVWGSNPAAEAWCVRASAAGLSLATLLAKLGGEPMPSFDTPDTNVVTTTNVEHPEGQCRLDTYFSGALCTKQWDLNVIPAKGFPQGQNSAAAEKVAMQYSCFVNNRTGTVGTRPACWFKQQN